MAAQHSHTLEHFPLHLLAVLLVFSTFTTSFLALGVWQNETLTNPSLDINIANAAGAASYEFRQTNFSGGADTNSTYAVPWVTSANWTKYYSLNNAEPYVDLGTGLTRIKSTAPGGEFISSIFDLGTTYPAEYMSGDAAAGTISFRGANSVGGVTSAS